MLEKEARELPVLQHGDSQAEIEGERRMGRFELTVACLVLTLMLSLHAMDVVTTLERGGVEAENNLIAITVWNYLGIWPLIACKAFSCVLFAVAWWAYSKVQYGNWFRLVLSLGCVGTLVFNTVWNLMVTGGIIAW
jgi:hypothetical protein